jgi:hypothetical protein
MKSERIVMMNRYIIKPIIRMEILDGHAAHSQSRTRDAAISAAS